MHFVYYLLTMRRTTVAYTGVYNVLDYSAVSFPTGLNVDRSIDVPREDYAPLSSDCKDVHETCAYYSFLLGALLLIRC